MISEPPARRAADSPHSRVPDVCPEVRRRLEPACPSEGRAAKSSSSLTSVTPAGPRAPAPALGSNRDVPGHAGGGWCSAGFGFACFSSRSRGKRGLVAPNAAASSWAARFGLLPLEGGACWVRTAIGGACLAGDGANPPRPRRSRTEGNAAVRDASAGAAARTAPPALAATRPAVAEGLLRNPASEGGGFRTDTGVEGPACCRPAAGLSRLASSVSSRPAFGPAGAPAPGSGTDEADARTAGRAEESSPAVCWSCRLRFRERRPADAACRGWGAPPTSPRPCSRRTAPGATPCSPSASTSDGCSSTPLVKKASSSSSSSLATGATPPPTAEPARCFPALAASELGWSSSSSGPPGPDPARRSAARASLARARERVSASFCSRAARPPKAACGPVLDRN
mmetsp:Transcript_20605/g.79091  ORF Transcript_20605/g.79091 Transcript_20605/m.79091 type:complete len:398 (-) Transcript_20605:1073-2266(-)